MSIAINPIFPVIGAQGVAPGMVLQPGTVIDATVLKVLDANLVRIAIANLSIEVLSEVPLKAGQTLQLAVSQTEQGVKLAIVPKAGDGESAAGNSAPANTAASSIAPSPSSVLPDDAPSVLQPATNVAPNIAAPKIAPAEAPADPRAARPLTNIEALTVSAVVQTAAAKQASLSPLFANLNVAASLQSLPPALQEAAAKLLSVRPQLNANLSGDDVKAAFEKSGLFLEQSLAAKANSSPNSPDAQPAVLQNVSAENDAPDLKAALIVFRQTVASWLGDAAEPQASPPSVTPTSTPSSAIVTAPDSSAEPSQPNSSSVAQQPPAQTSRPGQGAAPSIVPGQAPVLTI